MKCQILLESDYMHPLMRARITYHSFKREEGRASSLKAGGNISFHKLAASPTSPHCHEFPELLLVIGGRIWHIVNGARQSLSVGSLAFIRPDDIHGFELDAEEDCELINFAFSLELLLDLSAYLRNDYFMKDFTAPPMPPLFILSPSETESLAAELLKVNSTITTSIETAKIQVKSVIASLFVKFFLERYDVATYKGIPSWLDRLCSEMSKKQNLLKGLRVMRKLAPCTKEHLCKSFKRYLGKSPTDFINEARMRLAASMLADTEEEIAAVASEVGIENLSHFYHLFKNHYGVSPAKYRLKTRKSEIPLG